ncbi:MAG: amino acid permease [Candidatus Omnitrophica bacterium]|nr:amino acid permease [Candidatus Omnitrophota bacterium]
MKNNKKLGFWDVFSVSFGGMISSGLFILPAIVYKHCGPAILIAYFFSGILLLPTILSKAELVSAMPKAGGAYFFIERSLGTLLGFFSGLAGWFSVALKSAFALIGVGVLALYFYPQGGMDYLYIKIIAAVTCVFFVVLNMFGIKASAWIQNLLVLFIFLACSFFIFLGFEHINYSNFTPFLRGSINDFLMVVGMVFVSYGGLTKIAAIAEDVNDPAGDIPKAMGLSFVVVQFIYCLCVWVIIGLFPADRLISTFMPLTDAGYVFGGRFFAVIMSIAAFFAFVTTANAGIMAASRVPFAMSKDGLLPDFLGKLAPKRNVPDAGLIFTGVFMVLLILFLDLEALVKTASMLMILLFAFENVAVIVMRESKIINYKPTFRSPFYPWLQIFACVIYIMLIAEMGVIYLYIGIAFIIVSGILAAVYSPKVNKEFALVHLVKKITDKKLADSMLESELKDILHKRDNIIKDRFDRLIERCEIVDLDKDVSLEEMFGIISEKMANSVDMDEDKLKNALIERENTSHTVIEEGLAIPHIVIEGNNKFEILLLRSVPGVKFLPEEEPVHVVFVLIGSADERNFHLRILMSIAQIVREDNFYNNFKNALNADALGMLLLSSSRVRH